MLLCFTAPAHAAISGPVLCEPQAKHFECGVRLVGASVSINPALYNFGVRIPGSGPSAAEAFTLTNTGEVSLSAGWTALDWSSPESPDPEAFTITSDNCGTLPPKASCMIEVVFNPSQPGVKSGLLTFADATRSTFAVAHLEGAGQTVSLSPPILTFKPREVGSGPSSSKEVTVTNESRLEAVKIYQVALANQRPDPGQFDITGGTCTALNILPPNGICTVDVAFSPGAPTDMSADLAIIDNAPGAQQLSTLQGKGLAQASSPVHVFIFRGPAKVTSKRSAIFGFKATSAGTFECKLDSRPFAPCESPASFTGLKIGRHSFAVRTADGGGPGGAGYQWRVEGPRRRRT